MPRKWSNKQKHKWRTNKRINARREKFDALLIACDSKCQQCGCEVIRFKHMRDLYPDTRIKNGYVSFNGIKKPMATIEHLNGVTDNQHLTILCYKCNEKKGREKNGNN